MTTLRQAALPGLVSALMLLGANASEAVNYPQTIDLAVSSPDITIIGAYAGGHAGSSIAVGDFNGDNFVDLAIVACNARPLGGTRKGEVTIAWGPATLWGSSLDLASDAAVSRIIGPTDGDLIYCRVACGDFNGDAIDDILWGEPASPGYSWLGRVFMVLGSPSFPDTVDVADPMANVVVITGHAWLGTLGDDVGACDFDGDGKDEIVMAASYMPNAEIYLLKGTSSFKESYWTGSAEPGLSRFIDPEENRGTGRSIVAGDIDGDLREDLILGAPGNGEFTWDGRVTIIYGSSAIPDSFVLTGTELRTKRVYPEYQHGGLGGFVDLGDVDGDGKQDLAVSASGGDPLGCADCGEAYVVRDVNSIPDALDISSSSYSIQRLLGGGSQTQYGIALQAGDFDRDGRDDLVMRNDTYESNERQRVVIVHSALVDRDTVMLASDPKLTTIYEKAKGTGLGRGVEIEDLDGDGFGDVILGADRASPPTRGGAGEIYVFFGCGTLSNGDARPVRLMISPGRPNPFSVKVTFDYELPQRSAVRATVHDLRGRRVATLAEGPSNTSIGSVAWDGNDDRGRRVASGIYFLRFEMGATVVTRKVVLMR